MNRKVCRLSFRVEGGFWVAYFSLDNDEIVKCAGSIAMVLVENDDRKRAFVEFMKGAIGEVFKVKFGIGEDWSDEQARDDALKIESAQR